MPSLPNPCYLVTGATGFLGRHVVPALRAWGASTIRCLVRRPEALRHQPGIELIVGDLADASALTRATAGADAIVHLAGLTHTTYPPQYDRVNADGTARLVVAAKHAGVRRFVFASSRAIGVCCGAYAASKRRAEAAIRESGIPFVMLRFAEIYGPDGEEGLAALLRMVRTLPVVPYVRGAYLAPVAVDDAVRAVLASLDVEGAVGKTYTIAGPESYRLNECVRMMASALDRRRWCVPIPVPLLRASIGLGRLLGRQMVPDQVDRLLCAKETDTEPAARDLGFTPRRFVDGLQRLIDAS